MTSEQIFWKWFQDRENELFHFEADQERIFDSLAEELQKVNPHLTFEFSPEENGKREFVISAGGIKKAFPAVTSLKSAAPVLPRWHVIAFRPRRAPMVIQLGDKRIDPEDVQFSLLDNGKIAGLYLFMPGYKEDDLALKQIGYLLLDEALGEYDVETKVGLIKMLAPEMDCDFERYPLKQLPALFDRLVAQLEPQTIH